MAAYAALVSVMQIIHQIQDCPFPPISIDTQQLQSLTEIITSLQKFLQGYSSPVADSDRADPLEMRIADAAYAAEDVIESYIVDVIKQAGRSTTTRDDDQETGSGEERRSSSRIQFHEALHQVTEKIGLIKKEAMEIVVEKAVVRNDHIFSSASASTSSSTMENSSMVGFDAVLSDVFSKLIDGGRSLQVIPVIGMGGIGKTTLVKNIYENKVIKKNFNKCAWVTVSENCDSKEILREILSQASEKELSRMSEEEVRKMSEEELRKMSEEEVRKMSEEEVSKMSEEDLKLQVHKYLFGRKYLIVLDDVWKDKTWDSTRNYFPDNNNGSRVVVTTRLSKLGSKLDDSNSVQMKLLDEKFSWELFTKTAFGKTGCPPELEEVGNKIAENCRGLPLSIVVVGGFLKKKEHTQQIWRSVLDDLTSTVMLENEKHCLKLLKKSYNHLPVHLKPCFLYLGLFEEDDEISVKTLIRLWVSEGFVRPRNGQSLETIALGFIKELDDRNLIIIDEWWCTENIKSFKLHDLLMDLCSREGQTQRFYHVIRHKRRRRRPNRCRRLLIDDTTSNEEAHEALKSMPLVRSIICEENDKVLACQNLGLLRILNEYTSHVDESDGSPLVFQFVNLRHAIVEVQSKLSISHLWNLQTLIVYAYERLEVPIEIWRMRQLRHIEFIEAKLHLPDPPVDEVVVMKNLHTLKGVENLKLGEEVIKRIPNIKRLLIENDHTVEGAGDDYYCVTNIERLRKLESLTYQEKHGRVHNLNNLKFPNSIKKLTLRTSYDGAMMEKIGSLPLLLKLKLMSGSFRTGKWKIGQNQFKNLRSLTLFWCNGLKHWTTAKMASPVFPTLERLRLSRLTQMNLQIPSEIGNGAMLKSIELSFCSKMAVKSARRILDDLLKYQDEEDLGFHVVVMVDKKHKKLESLASRNFEVEVYEHS